MWSWNSQPQDQESQPPWTEPARCPYLTYFILSLFVYSEREGETEFLGGSVPVSTQPNVGLDPTTPGDQDLS